MKMKNGFWILLIIASLAAYMGYLAMDSARADTQPPQIHIASEALSVSVQDPKSALLQGVTATDKKDGNVTDSLVVEKVTMQNSRGTVSVTYAAMDAAGNVAKAERSVTYTDYVGPRFTLKAPLIYTAGTNYDILSNIGAVDALDGDIQHRVRAMNLEDASLSETGTHIVQFQVTNSLGDTHTQTFPVELQGKGKYDAELALQEYLIYLPAGSYFNASNYLKSFTLQDKTTSLQAGLPAHFSLQTKGQVLTQNPGTYTVEYTVTYTKVNENNPALSQQYTGYSKLIVIVEG